ncbi:MAG: 30S ribosomal protein S1 [Cytophagales bacterium]|nr:30S ribosomal protein S1 [Cytophagales bacterium]
MNKKEKIFNGEPTKVNKKFGTDYTDKEREELNKFYEEALTPIKEHEVVKGTVVSINDRDVIVNVGFKSDGLVPLSEFRGMPDLKVGDEIEVYVERQENSKGQLVLSRKKANLVSGWNKIQAALDNDKVIEGLVKRRTKGGLIVDIFGIESFLPGSQVDVKPIRDFDVFVGKKIEVKVVKINHTNDNVVVSHKILIEKDLEKQKGDILSNLEKGQILEGVIKNMTAFGVFIDLGGVDGLLHITDISWRRVNHPEEVLELGQKVKVVVIDFDESKRRISLGMKQLTSHPWESLPAAIETGAKVKGKIVNVADYGAFLELIPGVEGLIHISEMSWSQHLRNPQNFVKIGDEVEAVVLTIDREERKISLGIKQLTEDPWTKKDILDKYAVGTKNKGIIRGMAKFGVFIELEEGIDGLLHISDMSWTKKSKHPTEALKVGDELETVVLEVDAENRRLALGLKQLEENPWDTFEKVFEVGSVHKGTIIKKVDRGAVLELPYGVEGFVVKRNLIKIDGKEAEVGEILNFQVIDISKKEQKILLSHTTTFAAPKEKEKLKKKAAKKFTAPRNLISAGKSKLGDIEALASLKEQIKNSAAVDEKSAKKKIESSEKATKGKVADKKEGEEKE